MMFNTNVNGDPRSFMYYNGDYYVDGTEITLTDNYMKKHKFYGKKLWKYAKFHHQTIYNNQVSYFFCATRIDWLSLNGMGLDVRVANDYAPYFVVTAMELNEAIDDIIKPIKLSQQETDVINEALTKPKSDFDNNGLIVLWLVYIAVMVGSLMFKQFYIIWAIASFLFFKYRKELRQ